MFVTTATALPRIMTCIGSARMQPSFPNIDNDRTLRDEGDAAHWVAKEVFDGRSTLEELNDRRAPNGVYVTPEMSDHVGNYLSSLNYGDMEIDTSFGNDRWRVNARADHIVLLNNASDQYENPEQLIVDDLKYGWRPVNPEDNWTLLAHAMGFCITRRVTPAIIHLRIHQPRPMHRDGKLRTWTLTYDELMQRYATLDQRLSNPTDELRSSIEHCGKCHANATCPVARAAGYNAIDAAGIAYRDDVTDEELAYELDELEAAQAAIDGRVEALSNLAAHRIRETGAFIRNRAWEQRYGNRRWKEGITPEFMKTMTGKDLSKPGMITPAAAERLDIPKAVVAAFTETPSIGGKLVRVDSAKRAAKLLKPT